MTFLFIFPCQNSFGSHLRPKIDKNVSKKCFFGSPRPKSLKMTKIEPWRYDSLRREIWTAPLILQFNVKRKTTTKPNICYIFGMHILSNQPVNFSPLKTREDQTALSPFSILYLRNQISDSHSQAGSTREDFNLVNLILELAFLLCLKHTVK